MLFRVSPSHSHCNPSDFAREARTNEQGLVGRSRWLMVPAPSITSPAPRTERSSLIFSGNYRETFSHTSEAPPPPHKQGGFFLLECFQLRGCIMTRASKSSSKGCKRVILENTLQKLHTSPSFASAEVAHFFQLHTGFLALS